MREMKDSGVEWIGEIPVDWKLSKIKHHFQLALVQHLKVMSPNIGMGILFGLLQPISKLMMFL